MSLEAAVRAAVERVRPVVQLEGGDLRFVAVDEAAGRVTVALLGACGDCEGPHAKLIVGVERALREMVPGVRAVENLSTDALRAIDAHLALERARGCAPGSG